jgi:GTP cyclohydrolase IA
MQGHNTHVDLQKLEQAQRLMAEALGEDSPEALQNSPDRFARWQKAALVDPRTQYDPDNVKLYPVPPDASVDMVTMKVTAYSACEHHYAPAWLKATIGYLPGSYYIGYSKLVKMFKHFACNYTMDERICNDFMREFVAKVQPRGAGILLRGKHFCVISRGGNEQDFPMLSAFSGEMKSDDMLRREFYQHAMASWDTGT